MGEGGHWEVCRVRTTHPTASWRQTNPIGRNANEGQVLDNKEVSGDSLQDRLEETKPIGAATEASEWVAASSGEPKGLAAVTVGG